jgi:energy-converting hydrogenase Eha subunit H
MAAGHLFVAGVASIRVNHILAVIVVIGIAGAEATDWLPNFAWSSVTVGLYISNIEIFGAIKAYCSVHDLSGS